MGVQIGLIKKEKRHDRNEGRKKVLMVSCIVIALLSIFVANQWMNATNNGSGFNNSAEYLAKMKVKDRIEDLEGRYGSYECIVKPRDNYTLVMFQPENMEFNHSYEVISVYVRGDEITKVETEIVTPRKIPAETPKNIEMERIIDMALSDPEVKEKVDFLERKYGEITPEVEVCGGNRCIVRFNLHVDQERAENAEKELTFFSHEPHGFSCEINVDAGEVEEIYGWHFEEALLLDIILAKHEARSKLETLKGKYGDVSIVYSTSPDKPDMVEIRFTPEFNPHEGRTEKLYGILCIVDTKEKKVVKIEEFDIHSISVPTPPPSFGESKLKR